MVDIHLGKKASSSPDRHRDGGQERDLIFRRRRSVRTARHAGRGGLAGAAERRPRCPRAELKNPA